MFDVTDPNTFGMLETWRDNFLLVTAARQPELYPFVVIGNKTDLPGRTVKTHVLDEINLSRIVDETCLLSTDNLYRLTFWGRVRITRPVLLGYSMHFFTGLQTYANRVNSTPARGPK